MYASADDDHRPMAVNPAATLTGEWTVIVFRTAERSRESSSLLSAT